MATSEDEHTEAGQAGASARAEYERRRTARIARARGRWGTAGALLAGWKRPQHEEAWARGARGEEELARRLTQRLRGEGVLLLHDRRVPRSRANIDHLAVGAGGVTVIDAKHLSGKIRAQRRGGLFSPRTQHLVVAGRDRTKLVDGLERQIETVRETLTGTPWSDADVRGCLCIVDAQGLPFFGELRVRNVPVVGGRGACKLAARDGRMAAEEVAALHRELALRLPHSQGASP